MMKKFYRLFAVLAFVVSASVLMAKTNSMTVVHGDSVWTKDVYSLNDIGKVGRYKEPSPDFAYSQTVTSSNGKTIIRYADAHLEYFLGRIGNLNGVSVLNASQNVLQMMQKDNKGMNMGAFDISSIMPKINNLCVMTYKKRLSSDVNKEIRDMKKNTRGLEVLFRYKDENGNENIELLYQLSISNSHLIMIEDVKGICKITHLSGTFTLEDITGILSHSNVNLNYNF